MRRGKLIMIAVGVLAAGIFAALPYARKPQEANQTTDTARERALPLRKHVQPAERQLLTLSLSPEEQAQRSPAAEFLRSSQPDEPQLELPQIRRDEQLRSLTQVPSLSPRFRPFTETIRLLRDVDSSEHTAASLTLAPPADLVLDPPSEQPVRRHRISDGDTLASIAERYYDDPALALPLFEANRDVLSNPDVLPLGEHLAILPSLATPSPRGAILGVPQGVVDTSGAREALPADELAPIPAQLFEAS